MLSSVVIQTSFITTSKAYRHNIQEYVTGYESITRQTARHPLVGGCNWWLSRVFNVIGLYFGQRQSTDHKSTITLYKIERKLY